MPSNTGAVLDCFPVTQKSYGILLVSSLSFLPQALRPTKSVCGLRAYICRNPLEAMLSRNATQHRSIGSAHSTQCRRGGSLRRGSGLRPAAALPPVSGPQRDALPQGAAPRRNAQPPAASESTPDVAKYKLIDAIAGCIEINVRTQLAYVVSSDPPTI